MNYIWSKKSLLEFIYNWISSIVEDKDYKLSDLFAGTGAVGKYFKSKGHQVIANDLQYYSYILNRNYIGNHSDLHFTGLSTTIPSLFASEIYERKEIVCQYLEQLPWIKWFVYNNYSLGGTQNQEYQRLYYSDENAMKCDNIRTTIQDRYDTKYITENEYYFLLASLIESIDKVANTASVYGAFLKHLKKSALKKITMKSAKYYCSDTEHMVYNMNINDLVKTTTHDVVYLDPPYNHRQYSGNYHILETIARYDNPTIKGKTGMRDCSHQKSLYSSKTKVKKAFQELIKDIKANYIFLSYNDEWLLSPKDIKQIMSNRGKYGVITQEYKRFKADKTENRNHLKDSVIEYLHYIKIK